MYIYKPKLIKENTLYSLKTVCILCEKRHFPQAATLPLGTQPSSEFLYFPFICPKLNDDDLVKNPKLNPENHYRYKAVVFVTRTSV